MRCMKLTRCGFLSEMNIFAVMCYHVNLLRREINFVSLCVREIDILLVFKRNEHPCRHMESTFKLEVNKIELIYSTGQE